MNKKIFLFGVVLLMTGRLFAAEVPCLITVSADKNEKAYALTDVQRIVFENNTMTVKMKSASDVTGIVALRFDSRELGIPGVKQEGGVFVFPNPVKTMLTVNGADVNAKINLYNLNGALLKSILAQDGSTDVDVSSLPPGTYFLRVGEQTVKFIKQ